MWTARSSPSGPATTAPHRLRVLGAEIEDVADLDAARGDAPLLRQRREGGGVVLLVGRRVEARSSARRSARGRRRKSMSSPGTSSSSSVAVAEDGALAGLGEDDELVAEVAADRAGIGAHRDRLQAHAREGAQIGDEHPVVGVRARPRSRGRRNRRPSSGTRGRASRRSAAAPRRGTSTGCGRGCSGRSR